MTGNGLGDWLRRNVVMLIVSISAVAFAAGGAIAVVTNISGAVELNKESIRATDARVSKIERKLDEVIWHQRFALCEQGFSRFCDTSGPR